MAHLTQKQPIEIRIMVGYCVKTQTQGRTRSVVSKIEKETGHVRDNYKIKSHTVPENTPLKVLSDLRKCPHIHADKLLAVIKYTFSFFSLAN